jgi:nucleotide-binding universal stress UspA family protein
MTAPNNIAVAIDFNEEVEDILKIAGDIAAGTQQELHVVHVYAADPEIYFTPPYVFPAVVETPADVEESLQHEKERVRTMVNELRERGITATGYMKPVDQGVAHSILEFAEERDACLIVIGSHRANRLERLVLGSVSEAVLHKAEIPVLVVPRSKE